MGLTNTVAWAVIPAIALVVAMPLAALPLYLRHRTRHLIEVAHHLREMNLASRPLVRDIDVPDEVVTFMERVTAVCGTPLLARFVVRKVLSGDFFNAAQRASEDKSPLALAIEKLSHARRKQFTRFISHAILCSASSDPLLAAILRRVLLFGLMKDTASELEGSGREQALAVEATFAMPPDGDAFRKIRARELAMFHDQRRPRFSKVLEDAA